MINLVVWLYIIAQNILNVCAGGLGVWSNENCRMIPCGGDADDDQVCCECNQTSRQRLSRRQSPSLTAHPIGHFGLLLVSDRDEEGTCEC